MASGGPDRQRGAKSGKKNVRAKRFGELRALGYRGKDLEEANRLAAKGRPLAPANDPLVSERAESTSLVVSSVERSRISVYDLTTQRTEHVALELPGLPRSDQFAVGDTIGLEREGSAVVGIFRGPRRSVLSRFRADTSLSGGGAEHVLAANVDAVVIVVPASGIKPRLIDRYFMMAEAGGLSPIICVNKIDRWEDPILAMCKASEALRPYAELGASVVYVSALTRANMHLLRDALVGKSAVFSGLSGVGKSMLVNCLFGSELLATGEVRESDDRGRHTTTSSSLIDVGEGTLLIDTPGIRQLMTMQGNSPRELAWYFPEIRELQPSCQFADCIHIPEPNCAVKDAALADLAGVDVSRLSYARYESYLRMADPEETRRHRAEERDDSGSLSRALLPWVVRRQTTGKAGAEPREQETSDQRSK